MADPTDDDAASEDAEATDDGDVVTDAEDSADGDSEDEDSEVDDSEVEAAATTAKQAAPLDPKADVDARRAATKARMDAAGGVEGATAAKASADDPTGTKARRAGREAPAAKGAAKRSPAAKASADDPTGTKARREAATAPKKVPRPSKRTGGAVDAKATRSTAARSGNPKKASEAADSSRYTAPIPRSQLESPTWVPILMFSLLGVGMVVIFLTYVLWAGRPLSLGVGLAFILGGILAATQYR